MNRKYLGCFLLIFCSAALASTQGIPCNGAAGAVRMNPDATSGGFVALTASVDSSVVLAPDAAVCDSATVLEGAKILGQSVISGRATVRGRVEVNDQARVYGEAYLANFYGSPLQVMGQARVYGRAYLNGSVVVSGSAEVFGYAKILDYAQILGNSKVCSSYYVDGYAVLLDDQSLCNQ